MSVYVSPDLKGWSYSHDHEEEDWIKVKPIISVMSEDFDLHLVKIRGGYYILEATDDGFLVFPQDEYDGEIVEAIQRLRHKSVRTESDFDKFEMVKTYLRGVEHILKTPFNNIDPELTRARVREIRDYLKEIDELLDTFEIDS